MAKLNAICPECGTESFVGIIYDNRLAVEETHGDTVEQISIPEPEPKPEPEPFMTVRQVATLLGKSPSTVNTLVKSGKLQRAKIDNRNIIITQDAYEAYLESLEGK